MANDKVCFEFDKKFIDLIEEYYDKDSVLGFITQKLGELVEEYVPQDIWWEYVDEND